MARCHGRSTVPADTCFPEHVPDLDEARRRLLLVNTPGEKVDDIVTMLMMSDKREL